MTALDDAIAAMLDQPADESRWRRVHALVAEADLVLLLQSDLQGDTLDPQILELEEGPVALAFEGEDRLAEVAGAGASYAALPGRALIAGLAGTGTGLGINLGAEAPATVLPANVIDWLHDRLSTAPEETAARPLSLSAPDLPAGVLAAIAAVLAPAGTQAEGAMLAHASYAGGATAHLLVLPRAEPRMRAALARAVTGAAAAAGHAGTLDLAFPAPGDPLLAAMAAVAVVFDPTAEAPPPPTPAGPGTDPARPPRLR